MQIIIRAMDHDLKYNVMQRIKFIHFIRNVGKPVVVEGSLMIAAVLVSRFWVSFDNVLANSSRVFGAWSLGSDIRYVFSAVANADIIVQVLMAAIFVSLLWTARKVMGENGHALKFAIPVFGSANR